MKSPGQGRNRWKDHYSRQAEKERFPARSVYKLKELQRKYNLIKKGDRVLDLGCSPGSWLLYAAQIVGPGGGVVGVDLNPVEIRLPSQVKVYTADVLAPDEQFFSLVGTAFSAVLSDMAPATTGNKIVDHARSFNLCMAALTIAHKVLTPGGVFVCKIFQGEDFTAFTDSVKRGFGQTRVFKPQSSRKASREIYIIGLGKI